MAGISGELGVLCHTYLTQAGSHGHIELLEAQPREAGEQQQESKHSLPGAHEVGMPPNA